MAAPKDEQAQEKIQPAQDKPAQEKTLKQSEPRPASAPQPESQESGQDTSQEAVTKSPLDPYPAFDELELDELRSLAQEKGVGVPADVEKAALIGHLRRNPPEDEDKREASGEVQVSSPSDPYPSYDLMTVEELRGLVPDGTQALSDEDERGYLVGQLRAVASGPTAAQSAQVGSARSGESLDVPSGVSDKDRGRS
jgi:hypothetical protein